VFHTRIILQNSRDIKKKVQFDSQEYFSIHLRNEQISVALMFDGGEHFFPDKQNSDLNVHSCTVFNTSITRNPGLLSLSVIESIRMPMSRKQFKQVPRRFHPKGLNIIFEDHHIVVVDKRSGLLTVSNGREKEKTAYFLLNEYVKKGNRRSRNRVFIVHRLDRDTSGILIFAKSEQAKRYLQNEWKSFKKRYYALVHGRLTEKEGLITSYLAENSIHRMYSVTDPDKGKLAKTRYKVLEESAGYSLLLIDLLTGRKNQIRVHFSENGHPVAGDRIYGDKETDRNSKRLMLHSCYLKISHPFTKEAMIFESPLPPDFKARR